MNREKSCVGYLVFLAVIPAPVSALEICDDLWFTRNLTFHRAGYCFNSVLGLAVFGNAGCTSKSPTLSAEASALVAHVKALEAEWSCHVDTRRKVLGVVSLEFRKSLTDLPVATGYESGCIGWRGDPFALHLGRTPDSPVTATGRAGDELLYEFEDVGGWSYIQLTRGGISAGAGWARVPLEDAVCDNYAG
ncbi:DUF4453 domain-containing protein [Tropicimonas sp. IMCC6043]|uniref:DUF4453 domain-containing protein n=1 Tax=Tropicimonas sp. IMCC6043 TaxID=2510645 RepID=UPI00101E030C|nr:DUF4453 domain-containing protein [Tropicimonas sp. IMCC6043]RYH05873.1 DUF4453 domain-containing protein [Tropicimonas sp. IMCC6043]